LCRIPSDWCDKHALQKQFAELTEKSKVENYVIKGKLARNENEINMLKELDIMRADALTISDQVMDTVNS
jgi:hypothetical protein